MKTRRREIIAVIAAAAVFIAVTVFTSFSKGSSSIALSVFNTGEKGGSLLYDTLSLMEYPAEIYYQKINTSTSVHCVQIVMEPFFLYYTDKDIEDIAEWVRRGGRVVFLHDGDELTELLSVTGDSLSIPLDAASGDFTLYRYGLGEALTGSPAAFSNKSLMNNSEPGIFMDFLLEYWAGDTIYFNEYYHGYQSNPSLWRELPEGLRFIVYQILLVTVFLIICLGKRFGRPVPYYAEIEREENEYLKALANIYENAGMGEFALAKHYERFLKRCAVYFNSPGADSSMIITLWRDKKLPGLDTLTEINGFISSGEKLNTKKAGNRSLLMRMVRGLDKLDKEINVKYH